MWMEGGRECCVCVWMEGVGVVCVYSPQVQRCVSWPVRERSHQMVSWLRRRGRCWLNTTRAGPRRLPSNTDEFLLPTLQPFYIGIMFIMDRYVFIYCKEILYGECIIL